MLVLLFTGLLLSRALVSFASVLMVVPFLFHYRQVRVDEKKLLAIFLLLLPVVLSVSWSDNKQLWWNSVSVKLPLVTMLLGISAVSLSVKQWTQLVWLYCIAVVAGCGWSMLQYASETTAINAAYLKAKTLPTPTDNDHIRFSWMVVVAIVFGWQSMLREKKTGLKILLMALLSFLVIYLHILAAKTGLVCFYTGCLVYLLHVMLIQKKWKTGVGLLVVAVTIGFTCYQTIPTLRNRMQYVIYDFSNYSQGNLLPGYTDASRVLSIKAGYAITKENSLYGVGFGDMLGKVNQWHQANHPGSLAYERFLPANEWLVYGTGSGLPGLLCFTAGFCLLLYSTTSKNALSIALTVLSVIPFLIDDTLEGQYGVVLLAFIAFFGQQKLTGTPA